MMFKLGLDSIKLVDKELIPLVHKRLKALAKSNLPAERILGEHERTQRQVKLITDHANREVDRGTLKRFGPLLHIIPDTEMPSMYKLLQDAKKPLDFYDMSEFDKVHYRKIKKTGSFNLIDLGFQKQGGMTPEVEKIYKATLDAKVLRNRGYGVIDSVMNLPHQVKMQIPISHMDNLAYTADSMKNKHQRLATELEATLAKDRVIKQVFHE